MIGSTSVGPARTVQGNTTLNNSKPRISGVCKKVAVYALMFLPRLILAIICSPAALFGQNGRKFALGMWNTLRFHVQSKGITRIEGTASERVVRSVSGICRADTVHARVSDLNLVNIINQVRDSGFTRLVDFDLAFGRFSHHIQDGKLNEAEKVALSVLIKKYSTDDLGLVSITLQNIALDKSESLIQKKDELSRVIKSFPETLMDGLKIYAQISELLNDSQKLILYNPFEAIQKLKIEANKALLENITVENLGKFLRTNFDNDLIAKKLRDGFHI
jgi:hypothetical protein